MSGRTLTPLGWTLAAVVLLAMVLALGWCAGRPGRDAARQAEAETTIAGGRTKAAQDAGAVRDANDAAHQSIRNEVKEAQDAIRTQDDPDRRDAVARERLCKLNPGACAR